MVGNCIHKFGRRLCFLALLAIPWAVGTVGAQELVIAPGEPIVLAILSSRQGAAFGAGHTSELGVLLAQEDRPSITLDGRAVLVELSDGDSACSAEQAASLAEDIVADGHTVAVIGPNCSSACLAAAPIFDAAGFTSLSPSCTAPTLTEQGFTSFHRLDGSDHLLAERAARFFLEELSGSRLALLHTADVNPVFYEGQAESVGDAVLARGGEIVSEIALTTATDFASLLPGLEGAAPDLLYCACVPEAAAALLAALAPSPLKDRPLMVVELDDAHQLIELASEAAEGVYAVSSSLPPSEAREALAARYEERLGAAPQSTRYSNAYDAYQLLLDAVEAVGVLDEAGALHIDRAALNHVIRNTSDYAGVTGLITCDETGECLRSPTGVYQILDGNLALRITYDD